MHKLDLTDEKLFEASLVHGLTLIGKNTSRSPEEARIEYRVELSNKLYDALDEKPERACLIYQFPEWDKPKFQEIKNCLLVGRHPESDPGDNFLALPDQKMLSKKHFLIQRNAGENGDSFTLIDSDSTNGTFINSEAQRQTQYRLKSGDFIYAGNVLFNFVGDLPEIPESPSGDAE